MSFYELKRIYLYSGSMNIYVLKTINFIQKHFLWMIDGPCSSYSYLFIHMVWKVDRDARMEPPSQTENFLSGEARILILLVVGAN